MDSWFVIITDFTHNTRSTYLELSLEDALAVVETLVEDPVAIVMGQGALLSKAAPKAWREMMDSGMFEDHPREEV